MDPKPTRIEVELSPAEAEGIYSNLAFITHSQSEFIVDFARLLPGLPKAKVFARVILTPQNAKALHKTLGVNLERYENTHGEIRLPGQSESNGMGFRTES